MAEQPLTGARNAASRAESLDQFRYLQQIYQNQYMLITQEINSALEYIRQLDGAQKTIERLDSLNGKNNLVPVGADVYVGGKLSTSPLILTGIGAGYLIERKLDEAKGYMSERNDKALQNVQKLIKNKNELESALIEISYKIEEISR